MIMARSAIRLNGIAIRNLIPDNMHRVAHRAQVSYPTAHKYFTAPETIRSLDMDVLAALLIDGCNIPSDKLADVISGLWIIEKSHA